MGNDACSNGSCKGSVKYTPIIEIKCNALNPIANGVIRVSYDLRICSTCRSSLSVEAIVDGAGFERICKSIADHGYSAPVRDDMMLVWEKI